MPRLDRPKRCTAPKTFVPLAHPPGHAQVDFGEAVATVGDVQRKVHFFCMDLLHSDACFVRAYPRETHLSCAISQERRKGPHRDPSTFELPAASGLVLLHHSGPELVRPLTWAIAKIRRMFRDHRSILEISRELHLSRKVV